MAAHLHQCLRVVNSVFQGLYMHRYTKTCTHTHTVIKMHLPPLCPLSLSPSFVCFLCSMIMVRSNLRSSREAGVLHGPSGKGVDPSSREGLQGPEGHRNQSFFTQHHTGLNFDPERGALKARNSQLQIEEVCIVV